MTETPGKAAIAYKGRRRDGVLCISRAGTEWLSTGPNGGCWQADCAYNISVPAEWEQTNLETYVNTRRERAGFDTEGPALLTGVSIADARGACCGPVTVYATAGVSNPAALPQEPQGGSLPPAEADPSHPGTVNLIVGTTHGLTDGGLSNLIAVAAEAKATTLLETTGFPGTTTDAIVVGHDPSEPKTRFSGSGTRVGAATRACVRESVTAALEAHYEEEPTLPETVTAAKYGVSTDVTATVFTPAGVSEDDQSQ